MMRFGQIDSQIAKCEEHLRTTGAAGTEVEFYLTQYLIVRVVAEFETRIRELIQRRCGRGNDDHIKAFIRSSARVVTKEFKIGDITGCLGRFGEDYADAFRVLVGNDLIAAWNNIYTNRTAVAHLTGVQMSLRDLKEDYEKGIGVIDAIVEALEMKPKELKNLK